MSSTLYSRVPRLLAGASLLALGTLIGSEALAERLEPAFRIAQAQNDNKPDEGRPQRQRPQHQQQQQQQQHRQRPAQQPPAARPAPSQQGERPQPQRPAQPQRPPQPQRPAQPQPQRPAQPERPAQPQRPAAQPPAAQQPARPATPQTQHPAERPQPPRPTQPTERRQPEQPAKPAERRPAEQPGQPAERRRPEQPTRPAERPQPQQPPAAATPARPQPPAAQGRPGPQSPSQPPAAQGRPAAPGQQPASPSTQGAPAARPGAVGEPPRAARDAREFIRRRDDDRPGRRIDDIRRERREVREGDRVFIREGDRTIVRQGDRTIIRHNELDRFAIGAHHIGTERRGDRNVTVIERGDGVRIITITDDDGRLIRRVRRDRGGREIVIINNERPRRHDYFVDVRPPAIRIPRERYIIEAERASPADIYGVFTAPPVAHLERRYSLDEVRYSEPLRQYMPRVDLDITFDSGSWQITPDQLDRLATIAEALNRAIEKNPSEVFLIEGHTDAVGADVDNLSLSDRRAEAVAVALTEQFQVPAENLVTQGYGEQYLKVQTEGAERENRRVAVRRITPLIDQAAN